MDPATPRTDVRTLLRSGRGRIVDVLVVARRPARRWAVAAALGLPAAAACAPDVAASRLAHPATPPLDAVLLVVDDAADLVWLRRQLARTAHGRMPVVAIADPPRAAGALAAGAALVTAGDAPPAELTAALVAVTGPGTVIDLDAARSA